MPQNKPRIVKFGKKKEQGPKLKIGLRRKKLTELGQRRNSLLQELESINNKIAKFESNYQNHIVRLAKMRSLQSKLLEDYEKLEDALHMKDGIHSAKDGNITRQIDYMELDSISKKRGRAKLLELKLRQKLDAMQTEARKLANERYDLAQALKGLDSEIETIKKSRWLLATWIEE